MRRSLGVAIVASAALAACNALLGLEASDATGAGGGGSGGGGAASSKAPASSSKASASSGASVASSGASVASSGGASVAVSSSSAAWSGGAGGSGGSTVVTSASSTGGASSSVGGGCGTDGTAAVMDPFTTLPDATFDLDGTMAPKVANGVVDVELPPGQAANVLAQSVGTYSLSQCTLSIEVDERPADPANFALLGFGIDLNDTILIEATPTTVVALRNGTTVGQVLEPTNPIYLRLVDDGTNVTFQYSLDDTDWGDVASTSTPSWIGAGYVVFGAYAGGAATITDDVELSHLNQ